MISSVEPEGPVRLLACCRPLLEASMRHVDPNESMIRARERERAGDLQVLARQDVVGPQVAGSEVREVGRVKRRVAEVCGVRTPLQR